MKQHLEYPELTMYQMVEKISAKYPDEPAYEFYGRNTSYSQFIKKIEKCARALTAMGIKKDDQVRHAERKGISAPKV